MNGEPSARAAVPDPVRTALDDFRQIEPVYGGEPSERTVLRLAYDNNNLYISIYAYDSEPDQIIATQKEFDGNLGRDDSVKIFIDPNLSRRNAYVFEVGIFPRHGRTTLRNLGPR